MIGMEPRASTMLGDSTTKLPLSPLLWGLLLSLVSPDEESPTAGQSGWLIPQGQSSVLSWVLSLIPEDGLRASLPPLLLTL